MKGKVKFFRESDGYGFLIGEDSKEYYFNVHDIKDFDEVPHMGNLAEFEVKTSKRGAKAISVVITKAPVSETEKAPEKQDNRITCPHCGRKIVPRMSFYKGEPDASYCPFCGGLVKSFSRCFIATSVYQDSLAPEVIALRRFRNEVLYPTKIGTLMVKIYYRISPPIADFIGKHPCLRRALKPVLDCIAERYG